MSDLPVNPVTVDFSRTKDIRQHGSGVVRHRGSDSRPTGPDGKLLTPKQIRARARRRAAKDRGYTEVLTEQEFEALYKPVEEWDLEELARGRPRDHEGNFRGSAPRWVTREVHEKSMERFKTLVRSEMSAMGVTALDTFQYLLSSTEADKRGRPLVPASVQLQAASFLMEHIVGKPTQRTETDISVKLQGILGVVMANPNDALASPDQGGNGYSLAHLPGHTIPIGAAEDAEIIDDDDE